MLRGSRLARQTSRPGGFEVGAGLARPITAYLLAVAVGVVGFHALAGRTPEAGPILLLIAGAALTCIPAAALTLELVHRLRPAGLVARATIGALAWIGWGLVVAVILAAMSRLTLVSEMMVADLILCVADGAIFGALSERRPDPRAVVRDRLAEALKPRALSPNSSARSADGVSPQGRAQRAAR